MNHSMPDLNQRILFGVTPAKDQQFIEHDFRGQRFHNATNHSSGNNTKCTAFKPFPD